MITVYCQVCKKGFDVKPYRVATAQFCGRSCQGFFHIKNRGLVNPNLKGNKFRQGKRPANAGMPSQFIGEKNPKWVEPIKFACSACGKEVSKKPWQINPSKSGYRFCNDVCKRGFLKGDKHVRYIGGPKTYRGRGWIAARALAVS